MNRRSFLKSVGKAVGGVLGLGFLPHKKKSLSVKDLRRLRDLLKKNSLPTVKKDGEEYYLFGDKDGYVFEGEFGRWEGVRFIETA